MPIVLAHVKWFVQSTDPTRPDVEWAVVLSERTALLVVVAAVALGLVYLLQRLAGDPHWPRLAFFKHMAMGAPTLLAVQAAITLVYAAVQPALFVPNMPLPVDPLGLVIAAVELLIAFSFITGLADWLAAITLILLWPVALVAFRAWDALDMLFWIGIGVVVLIVGSYATDVTRLRPWFRTWTRAWSARAVTALRVISGVAIVAPALSEKIWNPELGARFLQQYPQFNFMQSVFGLSWFSNEAFVLAAGVVEATIGVLLVSGLLTRVVILGMWVPFNIGVPFLPAQELIGHLPIFGIMYFLLVHGAGIAPGESLDRELPPGAPKRIDRELPAVTT